jgi:hypothetical protein
MKRRDVLMLLAAALSRPQLAFAQQGADAVGSVATLEGSATVTRAGAITALKVGDPVFKGDILQTGADGALGVTFDDETTLHLSGNAQLTVDHFIYEEAGTNNSALFNIASGTLAFVASAVAKSGDMKIATPTATMGIRGTTGVVEVPPGAAAPGATAQVQMKLYPDADGTVGRIEVFAPGGARLGDLSRGATGFAIRPTGPGRFAAISVPISAQQAARDRALVGRVFATQRAGRPMIQQRRLQRLRQRPTPQRPGPQRPGPERPGQQKPGPERPGQQKPGPERRPGPQKPPRPPRPPSRPPKSNKPPPKR